MTDLATKITSPSNKIPTWVWLLAAALVFALIYRLGYLELNGEEPRRAVVALEMISSGNWLVPHAYGMEYYNKPPLQAWILAGFMSIFGYSEYVVRLPGIISFLAIGCILYKWVRPQLGSQQALVGTFIFLTSADLLLYATVYPGEIDLMFTLFLFLNAIGIYQIGSKPKNWQGYLFAYGGLMLAIMTKGWAGLHFHFLALLGWAYYQRQMLQLLNVKHLVAFLSFVAIICLYYVSYSRQGNLTFLFLNHFIESGSKVSSSSISSILSQLIDCPAAILKISLPWSLLLLLFFKPSIRQVIYKNPVLVFCLIYIFSNIWIYWFFVDVRDRYLYPFVPFMCILLSSIIFSKNWWSSKSKLLIGVMSIMIALRMLYNIFIMPRMMDGQLSNDNIYRELVDDLVSHSEGNRIDILAPLAPHKLPFSYKNISQIDRQPVVPYQIPYYLILRTGEGPEHETNPVAGQYYLVVKNQEDFIRMGDILYKFTEKWYGKDMVLIKIRNRE